MRDFFDYDDRGPLAIAGLLRCADCGRLIYYQDGTHPPDDPFGEEEGYHHIFNPEIGCFLIREDEEGGRSRKDIGYLIRQARRQFYEHLEGG